MIVLLIHTYREVKEYPMNTINAIILILFGGSTSIALATTIDLFLPGPVERARRKLESSATRSFVAGLVNLVFWFVVLVLWFVWTQYNGGPNVMAYVIGTALAVLLLLAVIVPGLPGLVAVCQLIGERMGATESTLSKDIRGGLLLLLACLTPYVGWYIFTPAVVSTAVGAGLLTFFQPRPKPRKEEKE
jgi:hypothetical protein